MNAWNNKVMDLALEGLVPKRRQLMGLLLFVCLALIGCRETAQDEGRATAAPAGLPSLETAAAAPTTGRPSPVIRPTTRPITLSAIGQVKVSGWDWVEAIDDAADALGLRPLQTPLDYLPYTEEERQMLSTLPSS